MYVTFWSLSLYDITVPKERYDAEIAHQKLLMKQNDEGPSDGSPSSALKKKKEV